MTKLSAIENKISAVKKYLKILENYKNYSRKEIERDINIRGAVERYLYLLVQSVIDLAEAIVSAKNFRKPSTMSESFYILNEQKMISNELTEKMARMTGFRNVMAHDYEKIDYDIVYDVLQNRLKDVEEFISTVR
ncbi:MAG: hypothetical protein Athens101410_394 [Parcubacteria group bacterium Athens1014_10]|nr:MAG: hypothetical protein Athens101410_394 [Parcubacteria group bacterium Athens1014_10]TSD05473.1 MAG: hypothetical protein Athens071412_283 [Parcubacteria group bacterium Athens0714_12]